jgi:hypothetical protein
LKCSSSFDIEAIMQKVAQANMKPANQINLDKAVTDWYAQQRLYNVNVRGVEIKSAADTIAKHMKMKFKARNGRIC